MSCMARDRRGGTPDRGRPLLKYPLGGRRRLQRAGEGEGRSGAAPAVDERKEMPQSPELYTFLAWHSTSKVKYLYT